MTKRKRGMLFDEAPADDARDAAVRVTLRDEHEPHNPDWRKLRRQNGAEYLFDARASGGRKHE